MRARYVAVMKTHLIIAAAAIALSVGAASAADNHHLACTWDHDTPGVVPCGNTTPNPPHYAGPPPAGEPAYDENGKVMPMCAIRRLNVRLPNEAAPSFHKVVFCM